MTMSTLTTSNKFPIPSGKDSLRVESFWPMVALLRLLCDGCLLAKFGREDDLENYKFIVNYIFIIYNKFI